jgi:hypothetical protein
MARAFQIKVSRLEGYQNSLNSWTCFEALSRKLEAEGLGQLPMEDVDQSHFSVTITEVHSKKLKRAKEVTRKVLAEFGYSASDYEILDILHV